MAQEVDEVRGSFFGWILANLLGVAALGALTVIFPFLFYIRGMVASALIIGLTIGLAQWIALRRLAPIPILWIFTIPIGLPLGLMIIRTVPNSVWGVVDDESIAVGVAGYIAIGFMVGLIQWFLLRRQFTKSLVWLLSSAIGLGLGTGLVFASNLINQSRGISEILAVLVYASATGLALEWLRGNYAKSRSRLPNAT
jgi:hypothetical protein